MEGKIHVLALPYPAAGHITPLLHFTKRLASKGLKITLVIPTINCKSSAKAASAAAIEQQIHEDFNIEYISDGSENDEQSISAENYLIRLKAEVSKNLTLLIEKLMMRKGSSDDDDDVDHHILPYVLVYDSNMPWALEIAHRHGMLGAPFFSESCFIHCIYYNIFQGTLKLSSINDRSVISLPPLPPLEIDDLPCHPTFRSFPGAVLEDLYANKFMNLHNADWIFVNTFDNLESEVASWMGSKWPIKTIGPTIVKGEAGGFIKGSTDDNDQLIKKKKSDHSCMEWLDRRETNSVVYVSFGTVAQLSEEQMEGIGRGLISSNCNFIWVVRGEEESKLPAKIRSEISSSSAEKGLILEWCPQLEVLGHESVACFMTHCGWNSTIEALSSGVPMIGIPRLMDQMTNAKFIADVWEAGVRVKADSKGHFTSEEIEMCIKEVTQSKRGKELKLNALKWKQEIEKAVAPGGSSSKNIDDFVAELSSMYTSPNNSHPILP